MGLHQIAADLPHLFAQPLRLQYLNLSVGVGGMRQELLFEIECRPQVELEYRRVVRNFGLLLRGVQGQRAKVLPLDTQYADPNTFRFAIPVNHHP